ncbi:hypothetical protein M513_01810, partial [Trichuris suis]
RQRLPHRLPNSCRRSLRQESLNPLLCSVNLLFLSWLAIFVSCWPSVCRQLVLSPPTGPLSSSSNASVAMIQHDKLVSDELRRTDGGSRSIAGAKVEAVNVFPSCSFCSVQSYGHYGALTSTSRLTEQRGNMASEISADCYGDDREALAEFERFFNTPNCSDITLVVDDNRFRAHKIVLAKNSDVFERMMSKEWNGDWKQEIELIEEKQCVNVFAVFLRFLYCNHIFLRMDDALPVLILADKYNVPHLRKVCLEFTEARILPQLSLKEVFHVWFQYGTKCFHQSLVKACVDSLAGSFHEIVSSSDWEREWLSLDKEQLVEFLKSSELVVNSEYDLWLAVYRWIQNMIHVEKRTSVGIERILSTILPHMRFPMMTADELHLVEKTPFVEQFSKLFQPYLMLAYKYRALPLASRAGCREFSTAQFLLRNYTRIRWDKRFVIADFSTLPRYSEISFKVNTCGSNLPPQPWDWELKLHPKGVSGNCEEFKCMLVSSVMLDQSRAIEYMLSIVNDKAVLRSIVGKKVFSKSRYGSDLELEKKVAVDEVLMDNSPLLINDTMVLQLTLRPIE